MARKAREKVSDEEESLKQQFQEEEIEAKVRDMRTWKGVITYLAHYQEIKEGYWKPVCPFCGGNLDRSVDYGSVDQEGTNDALFWFKANCLTHGKRFLVKYFRTIVIPQTIPVFLRGDSSLRISDSDDEWPATSKVIQESKPRIRAGQRDPDAPRAKRGRPKHTLDFNVANPFGFTVKE